MGKGKAFSPDTEARLEAQAHSAIEESIRRRMARSFRSLKADAAGSLAQLLSSKRASGHFTEGLKSSRNQLLAPRERPHQYLQTPLDGEGTLVPADEYRFYGPPYELDNTNSWRFGQPGLTQYADKSTGYTTLAQRVIDHTGGGWGWAGVGFWYVPRTRAGLLEFRARIRVTYEYQLQSAVETAHSRGEVGIIVFSWNMQGQDFRQEPAASNLLWEDGTSWTEDHDFSNDLYSSGLRLDVALDSARRYSCFAYIFASIDASGTDGLSGSIASTDIWAWYPYLVTEEKGIKL